MSIAPQAARGASAYTRADRYAARPLEERGLLISKPLAKAEDLWNARIDDLVAMIHLTEVWD